MREKIKFIVAISLFIIIVFVNYAFRLSAWADILKYLFVITIILSSLLYGVTGGILASIFSTFIYFPTILLLIEKGDFKPLAETLITFGLFGGLGIFVGTLTDTEKKNRNYQHILYLFSKSFSAQENLHNLFIEFCKNLYDTFGFEKLYLIDSEMKEIVAFPEGVKFLDFHLLNKQDDNVKVFIPYSFSEKFTTIAPIKKTNNEKIFLILQNKKNGTLINKFEIKILHYLIQQFTITCDVLSFKDEINTLANYIEKIINNIPYGIMIYNKNSEMVYANNFSENILSFLPNTFYENMKEKISQTDNYSSYEIKAKEDKIVEVNIYKWHNEDINFIVILKDISEKRKAFLYSASQKQKTDFITSISHEIRTPLTSIKGFISTLMNDKENYFDETKKKEFYKIIKEETIRLSCLIEDLLVMGEIEENKLLQIIPEKVEVRDIINKVLSMIKITTDKHKFKVIQNDKTIKYALCDKDRTKQILYNLITNAVKYSPDGGNISVVVDKEGNFVKISVIDEGIGIDRDKFKEIFMKGKQIDPTRPGLGFGLYLAKNLVEAQGGKIYFESIKNFGSSFTFTLPLYLE